MAGPSPLTFAGALRRNKTLARVGEKNNKTVVLLVYCTVQYSTMYNTRVEAAQRSEMESQSHYTAAEREARRRERSYSRVARRVATRLVAAGPTTRHPRVPPAAAECRRSISTEALEARSKRVSRRRGEGANWNALRERLEDRTATGQDSRRRRQKLAAADSSSDGAHVR